MQALKALALIKTSKADEAAPLIAEVKASPSLDEATLQAITACCRELGNFTDIAEYGWLVLQLHSFVDFPCDGWYVVQRHSAGGVVIVRGCVGT